MAYRYPYEAQARMYNTGGWEEFSHGLKINAKDLNPRIRKGSNWVNLRGEYYPDSQVGALSRFIFTRGSNNQWNRLTATQPFYYGAVWHRGMAANAVNGVPVIPGPIRYSTANTFWPIALILQVNWSSGTYPNTPVMQYSNAPTGTANWTSFTHLTPSLTYADGTNGAHKARISLMGVASPVNWTGRNFRISQGATAILGFSYAGLPADPLIVLSGDGKNDVNNLNVFDTRSPTLDIGTGYRWVEMHAAVTNGIVTGSPGACSTDIQCSNPTTVLGTGLTNITPAANTRSAVAWRTWDDRFVQSAQGYTVNYRGTQNPEGLMWGGVYIALPTSAATGFTFPGTISAP